MLTETKQSSKFVGAAVFMVGSILLLIFVLGFFGPGERFRPMADKEMETKVMAAPPMSADHPAAFENTIRTSGKLYYRQADLQLAVVETFQANDEMEKIARDHKCEIANLVMEGNDESRRCTVELLVPSDQFDDLVKKLRKVGAVPMSGSRRKKSTRIGSGPAATRAPNLRSCGRNWWTTARDAESLPGRSNPAAIIL
jgi:hypothetical protein